MAKRIVELIRLESGPQGTFGVLRIDKQIFCATLEPPANDNQKNISCIPAQPYICNPVSSPSFGRTFEVSDVPGRTHILFHAGNIVSNTEGCILLGDRVVYLGSNRAVANSAKTLESFLEDLGREPFHFTIHEAY